MTELPAALQPLAAYPQFILYRVEADPSRPGKTNKFPTCPTTGRTIDAQDRTRWLTAADALRLAAAQGMGVGFVFTAADPFFFLDGDGCYDPASGQWSPLASELMAALPGAAFEVSSSGTGMHLFGRVDKTAIAGHGCRNAEHGIELYTEGRFAALTGFSAQGSADVDLTPQLTGLVARYFPTRAARVAEGDYWDGPSDDWRGPADDDELIERMLASKSAAAIFGGGLTFGALWNADAEALGVAFPADPGSPDAYNGSSADMALVSHLAFWTGRDATRMERLMLRSGLVRDKWEREDYRHRTIEQACGTVREVLGSAGRVERTAQTLTEADVAQQWRAEPVVPFAERGDPVDVLTRLVGKEGGSFRQAWDALDMPRCAQMLARIYGGAHEPVKQALLMRQEWQDGPDLQRTVAAACSLVQPTELVGTEAVEGEGKRVIRAAEQVALFEGCAFVARREAVWTPRGEVYKPTAFNAMFPAGFYELDADKVTRKPWEAFMDSQWLTWPRVDDLAFRPDLEPGVRFVDEGARLINSYIPHRPVLRDGDVGPFLRHIALLLDDPDDRAILLAWMAAVAQYPGVKFRWAPMLQGAEGNGKGLMFDILQYVVGRRYTHLAQAQDVGNKFNGWSVGKLLVIVHELNAVGNDQMIDALKPLISDDWIPVQSKGADQTTARNFANYGITTNREGALGKAIEGRRYAPFHTRQQTPEDVQRDMGGEYFPRLVAWLQEGGFAHVAHFLSTLAIPDALNPATQCIRAPETSSRGAAIEAAQGVVEQAILEAVGEERYGFTDPFISSVSIRALLTEMRREGAVPPRKQRQMMQSIGYDWHPAMLDCEGRSPKRDAAGRRARIYVRVDHPIYKITDRNEVIIKYEESLKIA